MCYNLVLRETFDIPPSRQSIDILNVRIELISSQIVIGQQIKHVYIDLVRRVNVRLSTSYLI